MKCLNCKLEAYEYDFCPHCGTPLNEKAKKVETQKNINIRLETLLKVTTLTEDEKTWKIINQIINQLSK